MWCFQHTIDRIHGVGWGDGEREGVHLRVGTMGLSSACRYYVVLSLDRGGHVMVVEKSIDVTVIFNL